MSNRDENARDERNIEGDYISEGGKKIVTEGDYIEGDYIVHYHSEETADEDGKKKKLFISYARDDDEPFVEDLYEDLTENDYNVWWDRKAMESRGRTFLQEIRDAIAEVDILILVIGPSAVTSEYVKYEWEYALEICKVVVPILRKGKYELIPEELKNYHCEDFREDVEYGQAFSRLLEILEVPTPSPGTLKGVPALPSPFLAREGEIELLSQTVLADVNKPTVISSAKQTVTLQGMGGVGKSVIAASFARECEVRRSFSDGVIWITVGQNPNLLSLIQIVGQTFNDDMTKYVEISQASSRLSELLTDKLCLIVLDDMWEIEHAETFVNAIQQTRCRLLITTRDGGLATNLGAQEHKLDVLTEKASLELLTEWVGYEVSGNENARLVAEECGNLPFALALCGAMVRDGTSWIDLLEALQEADLEFLERRFPNYPYPSVLRALKVSIDALQAESTENARHYLELGVFPGDTEVPEEAIMTLWLYTNGLKPRQARRLLTILGRKSLLKVEGEEPNRLVSLHDLQHDYLIAVLEDLTGLHNELIEAYGERRENGWESLIDDGYVYQHLAHHMVKAGREGELKELLFDFNWLQAKLEATDANSLVQDFNYLPEDRSTRLVKSAIILSAHMLTEDKTQLRAHLMGRLLSYEGEEKIQGLIESAEKYDKAAWLKPLLPNLTKAGGALLRTLAGHSGNVNSVTVTPDGTKVISGSDDNQVKVWDIESGDEILSLSHSRSVNSLTVTPDGTKVISGSDNQVKIWDIESGDEILSLSHSRSVNSLTVTPDGTKVISSSDIQVKIWDIETGNEILSLFGYSYRRAVTSMTVTPDGTKVISGSDNQVKIWDIETGEEILSLTGHYRRVNSVTVTPDGTKVISGSGERFIAEEIKIWDIETGEEIQSLTGHSFPVNSVTVTPDGTKVISGSDDNQVKMWDIETGKEIQSLKGHSDHVSSVTVTPDGTKVISGSYDKHVKIWDIKSGEEILPRTRHSRSVSSLTVTPDGAKVISGSYDKHVKIWDIESGEEIQSLTCHIGVVLSVTLTPDGTKVIFGSSDYQVEIWDIETGEEILPQPHHFGDVNSVTVTPDGTKVISGSSDNQVQIWDIELGEEILSLTGHSDRVRSVAVTPDSTKVISGSDDNQVKIWDIESGDEILSLNGHSDWVNSVTVTPNGTKVISGSSDNQVKIWDIESGEEILSLTGHSGSVWSVTVTPDGTKVISGSSDNQVKIWDIESGDCITTFYGEGAFYSCAISKDGKCVIAGDQHGVVHFFELVIPEDFG